MQYDFTLYDGPPCDKEPRKETPFNEDQKCLVVSEQVSSTSVSEQVSSTSVPKQVVRTKLRIGCNSCARTISSKKIKQKTSWECEECRKRKQMSPILEVRQCKYCEVFCLLHKSKSNPKAPKSDGRKFTCRMCPFLRKYYAEVNEHEKRFYEDPYNKYEDFFYTEWSVVREMNEAKQLELSKLYYAQKHRK
jgi:hypothetical protein